MRPFYFILIVMMTGCADKNDIRDVVLTDLGNNRTNIVPNENALTVIYFLSPECPLCINYTLAIRTLEKNFASDSLVFYGLFSKEWYGPEEVRAFALKYDLGFEMLFDDANTLANRLGATVTPEVFVLDRNGRVLYRGKIDNWVNELGKKKLEVSEHYLENALTAWREGKDIDPKQTEPIGCLIE